MSLDAATLAAVESWVTDMAATGRVATREPSTVNALLAGQLASRLAVPDPSLGLGPNQWDYQLAPFLVRVADNYQATEDDLLAALDNYSTGIIGFTQDLATNVGDVAHVVVQTAGDAVAAAIGIPGWLLWGGLAFGAYYVLTHVGETKSYVRALAA